MYVVTMGNIIFFIVWSCELFLFFQSFAASNNYIVLYVFELKKRI